MKKTKAAIFLIAASVLVAAVAGIAFAQFAEPRTARNSTSQASQGANGTSYPYPQQEYYHYGSQYPSPYGSRMGMRMCGCW